MPTKPTTTSDPNKAPRARKRLAATKIAPMAATGADTAVGVNEPGAGSTRLRPTKSPASPTQPTKSAIVLKLLGRAKGATIAEIAEPTGWQPHSTRAYLSGLRKKGHQVIREERRSGETSYRIGGAASPADKADVAPAVNAPIPAVSDAAEANDGGAGTADAAAPVDAEADAATTPEAAA